MSSWRDACAAAALFGLCLIAQAADERFPGIGRAATPKELAAWDIDVRPDFKGLPPGRGSVADGMAVWDGKCASCHGVFGESNQVFNPLVGGTTADDVRTGRVKALTDGSYPGRTSMMKLSTLSSLWDYIRRAMPWNEPKSLTNDEVYAVTAYMLHLAEVVPQDFVLSDRNVADVQQRLPNRDGMTTAHALWPGRGMGGARPDVNATTCMRDCGPAPTIASQLPEHARDAHGNLAQQNRLVGAQRGAQTAKAATGAAMAGQDLARKHACTACHAMDGKLVGPGFRDIGARYAGRDDALAHLQSKIRSGGSGTWGTVPMPPQALPDADAKLIAQWLAAGAR
jgi:cytochrome c551/c552